ncbi:MAG TPA: hypothetical protein VFO65_05500 [Acidimicrobiales bacterium]|nr:hypothetical protein [Acidimicrobiales bacterium]
MSYVYAGYGITAAALALYAARLVARQRALRAVRARVAAAPRPVGDDG